MDSFTFIAASNAVSAILSGLKNTDWNAAARDAAKDTAEDVASTDWDEVAAAAATINGGLSVEEKMQAVRSALATMQAEAEALDPELQDPAMRVVDANAEWLQAEERKLEAASQHDGEPPEARDLEERAQREIATFKLLQGMHDATKSSATALEEITAARKLADQQRADQTTFNKRMTWSAVFIALGSLLASMVMPIVEEFAWPDPPPPNVVVITESELTVPPLLRRTL
ncbi:hypothetical protein ACFVGV_06250 [Pseudarthrobacter scleromae]|uniref:hypothetical protein n=1 Tax=Pseudarthrobacter scleromae TaxID=158897 RepID=UPI00362DA784